MVVVILSGTLAVTAFAANPNPFPILSPAPPVNVDTDVTVSSRVSFDPNASVSITGAGDPSSLITTDMAQIGFSALDFKKVQVNGVKIFNHGSTNTIAVLKVDVPPDFLVDVKSSSDTVRNLSPTEFAVPISGAIGSTPGVTQVDIELMYWNNSAVITPASGKVNTFWPNFWSAFTNYIYSPPDSANFIIQPAYAASTITAIKFQDNDRDGVEDPGEPRLPGWTIQIYERMGDGSLILRRQGVTDANGVYAPTPVSGDDQWVVREISPSPPPNCVWTQIFPGAPTFEHEFFLPDNQGRTVKFGNVLDCTGALTVTKFFDNNRNGVQDVIDDPLQGWTIKVFDSTDTTMITQGTTGATGSVTFNLPVPQTYVVREEFPSTPPSCNGGQWLQTMPGAPSFKHTVSLTTAGASVKFGNALDCLVTVFKFLDENGNGVHDLSESGMQGWNMQIYDETGTNLIDQEFTDSSGVAVFSLTQDNTYVAREVIPEEASCLGGVWKQTFPGAPDYEEQFYLPNDGGASIKFGNEQICPTERYIVTLTLSSLD